MPDLIGIIILIVWWATKGDATENSFGPAPVPSGQGGAGQASG